MALLVFSLNILNAQSAYVTLKLNGITLPQGASGPVPIEVRPSCSSLNEFCFTVIPADENLCEEEEFSMQLILQYYHALIEIVDFNGFTPTTSPDANRAAIQLSLNYSDITCEDLNLYCVTFRVLSTIYDINFPNLGLAKIFGPIPEEMHFGTNQVLFTDIEVASIFSVDGTTTPVKISDLIGQTDQLLPHIFSPNETQTMYVDGVIEIDESYTFGHFSSIDLGPNARIVIKSGNHLIMTGGSSIAGCKYMWDRILIEPGGRFTMFNGIIKDGITAIAAEETLTSETRIGLYKAKFENNLTGIYTPPLEGTEFHNPFLLIDLVEFRGTSSTLKPTWVNNTVFPGVEYPYVAMDLNKMKGYRITNTLIEDMANGLRFSNSYVDISNITINNMIRDEVHRNEGIGINSMGQMSSLVIEPSGSIINDMRIGIRTTEGNLDVKDVTITNVRDGIYSVASFNKRFNIENCNITATNTGISQITGKPLSGAIANNKITIDYSAGTGFAGIRLSTTGSEDFAVGPHNVITLGNAPNGILLSNSRLLNVHDNEIENTNKDMQLFRGIAINGGMGNIINCNELATIDKGLSNGIFLNGSGSTEVTCNTPDGFLHGIGVYATNARSQLRGNTLPLSNETGLYYSANASTGLQYIGTDFFGNQWPGTARPTIYRAYHEGNLLHQVNESLFQVDNKGGTAPEYLPNWYTHSSSSEWFRNRSGDNFVCPGCDTPQLNWWDQVTDYDERIADTLWYDYDFSAEQHDLARRQLLWHLDQYGVPSGTATFYGDFQTDMSSEQTGDFYSWEQAWESGLNWSGTVKTQYLNKLHSIDSLNQLIHLYDSLNPSDSILSITRLDYLDQMKTLLDDQILSDSAAQAQLSSHIAGSLFTMPSASNYVPGEADMVAYYTLFLLLQGDTLTSSEKTDLTWAAQLCPLEGGNAVFLARELYAYFVDDTVIFDDSTGCIPLSAKPDFDNDHEIIAEYSIEVWPNPVNEGNLLFLENKNDVQGGIYQLIDLHGRIVDMQPMQPQLQWQIKVPSGIYILRATYEDGKTETHKIRIIK